MSVRRRLIFGNTDLHSSDTNPQNPRRYVAVHTAELLSDVISVDKPSSSSGFTLLPQFLLREFLRSNITTFLVRKSRTERRVRRRCVNPMSLEAPPIVGWPLFASLFASPDCWVALSRFPASRNFCTALLERFPLLQITYSGASERPLRDPCDISPRLNFSDTFYT